MALLGESEELVSFLCNSFGETTDFEESLRDPEGEEESETSIEIDEKVRCFGLRVCIFLQSTSLFTQLWEFMRVKGVLPETAFLIVLREMIA